MYNKEDVVQKTLAQAAVVSDESNLHSDQLSGQSSSAVVEKQMGESGQKPHEASTPKRKKKMVVANFKTRQTSAR